MKKSASSSPIPCGNPTTTECVTWQGGDLACLGIENGQKLSESAVLIAEEVCALKDMMDLSDLDLKCIFDICISCPEPEKTLKIVLELLISKVCSLQEIINELLQSSGDTESGLVRMASCFQYTDTEGDTVIELPHEAYTKRVASKVCELILDFSSMDERVQEIEDEIDDPTTGIKKRLEDLENDEGDEVDSDCLFNGTKTIPEAFELLDAAFCQIRNALGSTTDMNLALSRLCDDLNDEYISFDGWIPTPLNLSQGINNLMIVVCDLRERTAANEACCAATCDDVKIGFSAVMNASGDGIVIRFTSGNGLSLPAGFEDKGSVLIITDTSGNSEEFNVTIENNGEEELIITGIDTSSVAFDLQLSAKVGNDSITCEKCVNKTVRPSGSCDYCEITATGAEGSSAVLVYEDDTVAAVVGDPLFSTSTTTTTTSSTTTTTTSGL